MNCPLCVDQVLDERFSHGIEVDVCPNCKGVWLDRGELERLAMQGRAAEDPTLLASSGHPAPHDRGSAPPAPLPAEAPRKTSSKSKSKSESKNRDWDDDRERSKKKSKKKKSKKKRFSDLLEDVLDDVLDL